MSKAGLWLNIVLATLGTIAFVSLAGFFGYKWLASDEPNVRRPDAGAAVSLMWHCWCPRGVSISVPAD